jgi:phosphoribosylformylglycinamidine synthase
MSPITSPATSFSTSSPHRGALVTLPGGAAFTPFETERLASRLCSAEPSVRSVHAEYLYLLLLHEGFDSIPADELGKLHELLELDEPSIDHGPAQSAANNGHAATVTSSATLFIAPRTGTQSPWSSKATDILRNTGFKSIQRIERARTVSIAA